MTINFNETTTKTISHDFYNFSKERRFSVLEVPKGFGKTAMITATCGEYAKELRARGVLSDNQPLDLVIVAPKAVINQHSWEETVKEYNEQFGNLLSVSETITSTGFGDLRANQMLLTKPQNIKTSIRQAIMKKARIVSKDEDKTIQSAYYEVLLERAKKENKVVKGNENVDQLETILYKAKRKKIKEKTVDSFLKRHQNPTILVIDEVQEFKNCKSSRGKALIQVLKTIPKALGLTAQPAPNDALDYVAYAVYGGFYSSYSKFLKSHITEDMQRNMRLSHASPCYDVSCANETNKAGDFKKDGVIDIDTFWDHVNDVIFKPKVVQNFNLPTVTTIPFSYALTEETNLKIKSYLQAKKNREYDSIQACIADIRNAIGSDYNHLRQIPIILQNMKRENRPIIQPLIFYQFNSELGDDPSKMDENDPEFQKGILWALMKCGIDYHIINGKNRFKSKMRDDLNKAIVIHYKSGGAGLNFPKSNLTIFYGLTYSWQDMEQAEGRNVRRGQSHDVFQYRVSSSNPADQRMQLIIQQKQSFTSSTQKAYIKELERSFGL